MDKEVVLENEYITVWYHNSTKIVHHQIHKFIEGNELQIAFDAGAAVLEKNEAKKWLSDDRKLPVMKPEDLQWTSTVWRPRVIKAGWKYWAIIHSEKSVGKMVMNKIIKAYADLGVTLQIFTDPDEALKWLESQ
jgi:hypothetical protein